MSKYELTSNDSIFWTTLYWYEDDRFFMSENPAARQAYGFFLYSIDSVKVHYKSEIYTYFSNDSIYYDLFYLQGQGMDIIYFNEFKKDYFGWK